MKLVSLVITLFLSFSVHSHSGRTDSSGGHNCSSNSKSKGLCSGYHYHNLGVQPKKLVEINEVNKMRFSEYRRKDWPHWIDKDNDCQDERQEILIATSLVPVKFKRNKGCTVSWGEWADPFSGKVFTKASDIDIDHIVPLLWAHNHGGSSWSRAKKREFANDPENLLPVDDALNSQKGASSPIEWLPPNRQYHCQYIEKFDAIVKKYNLIYDSYEKISIKSLKSDC